MAARVSSFQNLFTYRSVSHGGNYCKVFKNCVLQKGWMRRKKGTKIYRIFIDFRMGIMTFQRTPTSGTKPYQFTLSFVSE